MPLVQETNYYSKGANNFGIDFRAASGTWSPPVDMRALVLVIGGGASGGASFSNSGATGQTMCASGGGAGGASLSLLNLSASVVYSYTAGSGGASASSSGTTPSSGNAGGQSSFSGAGIDTMIANGGNAGNGTYVVATNLTAAGVTGGTASGGNIFNRTGGGSGTASIVRSVSSPICAATGGGAVQLFVDPSVEVLNSGDADVTSGSAANTGSGGANSHGASPSVVNSFGGGGAQGTQGGTYSLNTYHNPGFFWEFVGPGSGNSVITASTGSTGFGTPQVKIYGGGAAANNSTNSNYISDPGGIGGGSGGCAAKSGTGGSICYSDAGGNGLVYIYPVELKA
jgi:hypothetical protein